MPKAGIACNLTRILLVTPQPFYEDRGTPIAVRYVAQALSELGACVDILAFPVGRSVTIPRVTIMRCANPFRLTQVPIGFSWRKIVLGATLWQAFSRLVNSGKYHIVHAVEDAAYMACAICPPAGQPFIYDMASAIPAELKRNALFASGLIQRLLSAAERRVIASASLVVCSSGLGDYVSHRVPEAPVREWPYPAYAQRVERSRAMDLRKALGIRPNQRVILYSGNFAAYQGIELLLEAFKLARQTCPELALVCVGATDKELAALSATGATHEQVFVLRRQPRMQIPVYMELADFLVLPRVAADNVPLKLFDYMASGTPIIATRGPAHEPLLDESRAFMSDPTVEALSVALVDACASRERSAALGRAARSYATKYFGWDRFVDFVRTTYSDALSATSELRHLAA
ncbi:MAG: glycosyltransferase [Pseudomonadota bacterium]|nr:glycosyltransferase [Pseudomonadota bacterium]